MAEELALAHAGWDEMVAWAQERHARRNAPSRSHGGRRPIYGMRGQYAPEPREV